MRGLGQEGRRALAAGVGLIIAGVLPGFLIASTAPRIKADLDFGDSTLGLAIAVFYAVAALTSAPAGRLVEAAGAVRGARLAAGLTALACLAVAVAAQSAAGLAAALAMAALGMATGGPAVTSLLHTEIDERRQGLAFGAQQAGAPLGALLAGLALPVIAVPLGWRWAFVAAAVFAVLTTVAVPPLTRPAARSGRPRGSSRGRLGSVHALALAGALASAAATGFISFLVVYAGERGMSEEAAGLLLAALSLAATVSRLTVGVLLDRGGRGPLRIVGIMLALSAVGYLLLIEGDPPVIAIASLLAAGLGWAWPGAINLAVVRRSPQAPAWAVGVMLTGLFTGAVAGPLLVGLLAEDDRFSEAWMLCAALVLLAAAAVLVTERLEARGRLV